MHKMIYLYIHMGSKYDNIYIKERVLTKHALQILPISPSLSHSADPLHCHAPARETLLYESMALLPDCFIFNSKLLVAQEGRESPKQRS